MIFGEFKLDDAEGIILAHGIVLQRQRLPKGHALRKEDVDMLRQAGHETVIGARLDHGDVGENLAAERLARAMVGSGVTIDEAFTGRANIRADHNGVVVVDRNRIDRMNVIDEGITVATTTPFNTARAGQLIATAKIIPLAVPGDALAKVIKIASEEPMPLSVAPFSAKKAALIHTQLPHLKPITIEKSEAVMKRRLGALGGSLVWQTRIKHTREAVAAAVNKALEREADLVLLFGASAIADRRDILPQGIVDAGGEIDHFGIPVDPGNLLLLAHIGSVPIVGLPGCARSPKLNGLDFVLARLCADIPMTSLDLMHMGAGGLLNEIAARPQPREDMSVHTASSEESRKRIAGIVLAAGLSSRMGKDNKLLSDYGGQPLIRHVVREISRADLDRVVVVVGHESDAVRKALDGIDVGFVENPDYAEGLSASLRAGLAAVNGEVDGAIICLGDMPLITAQEIEKLVAAFAPDEDRAICVPTHEGKQGNPVLWSSQFFEEMLALKGDIGAKAMIAHHEELVYEVPMPNEAALVDVDTHEALRSLKRKERK